MERFRWKICRRWNNTWTQKMLMKKERSTKVVEETMSPKIWKNQSNRSSKKYCLLQIMTNSSNATSRDTALNHKKKITFFTSCFFIRWELQERLLKRASRTLWLKSSKGSVSIQEDHKNAWNLSLKEGSFTKRTW